MNSTPAGRRSRGITTSAPPALLASISCASGSSRRPADGAVTVIARERDRRLVGDLGSACERDFERPLDALLDLAADVADTAARLVGRMRNWRWWGLNCFGWTW